MKFKEGNYEEIDKLIVDQGGLVLWHIFFAAVVLDCSILIGVLATNVEVRMIPDLHEFFETELSFSTSVKCCEYRPEFVVLLNRHEIHVDLNCVSCGEGECNGW